MPHLVYSNRSRFELKLIAFLNSVIMRFSVVLLEPVSVFINFNPTGNNPVPRILILTLNWKFFIRPPGFGDGLTGNPDTKNRKLYFYQFRLFVKWKLIQATVILQYIRVAFYCRTNNNTHANVEHRKRVLNL